MRDCGLFVGLVSQHCMDDFLFCYNPKSFYHFLKSKRVYLHLNSDKDGYVCISILHEAGDDKYGKFSPLASTIVLGCREREGLGGTYAC